jgi:hypothetical protein
LKSVNFIQAFGGNSLWLITNILLSRASLKFINEYCQGLGLGNDPLIFQTEADIKLDDQSKKIVFWGKANILQRLHCGGFLVGCYFISLNVTL